MPDSHRLGVIGAGVMGTGIAALALRRGLPVLLLEVDPARRESAPARVAMELRMANLLGAPRVDVPPGTLAVGHDIEQLAEVTAVVESVPESAALKTKVLSAACAAAPADAVIATNTSAIPVGELAAAIGRPQWLVGTHFMNPPYLISSVELVAGPSTSEAALVAIRDLLAALGQRPIEVGDGPGFVSNRILMHMINDAARMTEEGRADPVAIDSVFTACLGHRSGPLATADLIGLDNVVDTLTVLHERTGGEGYRPCEPLLAAVREGRLGRKTGQGFFHYARA